MEENAHEGDVSLSGGDRSYKRRCARKIRRPRSPSSRMVANYTDVLMGPSSCATREAIEKLPLRHELACFSRSMAEACAKQCKMIARLKKEKRALKQYLKEMKMKCDALIEISKQMKADVDMVIKENQSLDKRNEELQAALEGEKEKVNTLDSRMDTFRELKMKLDTNLIERKRMKEKLQTALSQ
ncbi:hypothetical protein Dimus_025164, partial [Dionaea muscipula]